MNAPKISFIYAYPLDVLHRNLADEKGADNYPTPKDVKDVIGRWETLWSEHNVNDKIVQLIVKLTKRTPMRNIECFVYGGGLNPMSTPFLMPILNWKGGIRSDENFILTVIHELLHIFLSTDNQAYWNYIREKYNEESFRTQNHIILYALLAEIYQQLYFKLPPEFSRRDLPEDYARAIQLVNDVGIKEVIKEYKAKS